MAIRNNLDDIVNVDIEISTPGSSDESFNNVLLVVEGPVIGKKSTDNIGTKVISVAQTGELAGLWLFNRITGIHYGECGIFTITKAKSCLCYCETGCE